MEGVKDMIKVISLFTTYSTRAALLLLTPALMLLVMTPGAFAAEILVSAALSLKAPFEEMGRAFERDHAGVKVVFNFAASGVLQKQIEAGAPADIYASASPREMDGLEAKGLIVPETKSVFTGNAIVLIIPAEAKFLPRSFADLRRQEVLRIAIGNPATVPAGKYAEESLKYMGLLGMVGDKLVFAEHVRQVLDYVGRGEVDAGIVFLSDAAARTRDLRIVSEAPENSHSPVRYLIAVVKGSRQEQLAREFRAFVLSGEARAVLRKHGFATRG